MGAESLGSVDFPESYEHLLNSNENNLTEDINNNENLSESMTNEINSITEDADTFMNDDLDTDSPFYGDEDLNTAPVGTIVPVGYEESPMDGDEEEFMSTSAFEDGFGEESDERGSGSTVIGNSGVIRLGN